MGASFQPRFIFENELAEFGLPDKTEQANIMNLIEAASTSIDQYCGKTDDDGNGSLVYTTYQERLLLQAEGRNVYRLSYKPLATIDATTKNALSASGQYYDTGVMVNTQLFRSTTLSPILSASGRYGYTRRSTQRVIPDISMGFNPFIITSTFGGPPSFVAIDAGNIDFEPRTGEIWLPAGLYPTPYTEIEIVYNAGFDPRSMPRPIKHATAALVKNYLAKGGGTSGIKNLSAGGISSTFTDELIDPSIQRQLQAFLTVIAM